MDPTLAIVLAQMSAGLGNLNTQLLAEQQLRVGRQSDGAAYDMRALGASLSAMMMRAGDPGQYMDFATSSHAPTSQPCAFYLAA
jgi:hypothetical protein